MVVSFYAEVSCCKIWKVSVVKPMSECSENWFHLQFEQTKVLLSLKVLCFEKDVAPRKETHEELFTKKHHTSKRKRNIETITIDKILNAANSFQKPNTVEKTFQVNPEKQDGSVLHRTFSSSKLTDLYYVLCR